MKDADELLASVHLRIGGGIDIQTLVDGTVEVHWRRSYGDEGLSDGRFLRAKGLIAALEEILEYEQVADEVEAAGESL